MIDFDAYWNILAENCPTIGETVKQDPHISEGFVLAQDSCAEWDVPRFTNSAMDGFAIAFDVLSR